MPTYESRPPNFFIVGAPKAGTTALYRYLAEHPSIFMPTVKEPEFFADDLPGYQVATNKEEYNALFRDVNLSLHLAVGEASVWYLFSNNALSNIHSYKPSARIIVMLRNPIEMVPAIHAQNLYTRNENVRSFEKAWRLNDVRRYGHKVPAGCKDTKTLLYDEVGMIGAQYRRLLSYFPHQQVHAIFFEDFVADTARVYEAVLRFLNVPSDARQTFSRVNPRKRHRLGFLGTFTERPPIWSVWLAGHLKDMLGTQQLGVMRLLRSVNVTRKPRQLLSLAMHEELVRTYSKDIHMLSRLTGRDLAHWLH